MLIAAVKVGLLIGLPLFLIGVVGLCMIYMGGGHD